MPNEGLKRRITINCTEEELASLEALRERMQLDLKPGARATQRMVIMTALVRLTAYYADLDRDKKRQR